MRLRGMFPVFVLMIAACYFGMPIEDRSACDATGPMIPVVDPRYVLLRPLSTSASSDAPTATTLDGITYFHSDTALVNLRHFDLRTANVERAGYPPDTYVVTLCTNGEGGRLLGEWSSAHVGQHLGVYLDEKLIAAPILKTKVDSMILLRGSFSLRAAQAVKERLLRGGAA